MNRQELMVEISILLARAQDCDDQLASLAVQGTLHCLLAALNTRREHILSATLDQLAQRELAHAIAELTALDRTN